MQRYTEFPLPPNVLENIFQKSLYFAPQDTTPHTKTKHKSNYKPQDSPYRKTQSKSHPKQQTELKTKKSLFTKTQFSHQNKTIKYN